MISEEKKAEIEEQLAGLPIVQYEFLKPEQIVFSDRVRYVCETECPRYGTTWACPPAVGTVEECHARCMEYTDVFLFTTMCEVPDIWNRPLHIGPIMKKSPEPSGISLRRQALRL